MSQKKKRDTIDHHNSSGINRKSRVSSDCNQVSPSINRKSRTSNDCNRVSPTNFRLLDYKEEIERDFGSSSINIEDYDFFHGKLPRFDSLSLIKQNGDFLLRESEDQTDSHTNIVLTVFWNEPRNFKIQMDDRGFRFEGCSMKSIPELIAFYYITRKPVTERTQARIITPVKKENWEIHEDQIIEFDQVLGKGCFGLVKKGVYYINVKGKKVGQEVALKTCLADMTKEEKRKFLEEARLLRRYQHRNIVRVIGVCTWRDPMTIVMELIEGGSLLSFLKEHRERREVIALRKLIKLCNDAANGMEYLSLHGCIHRTREIHPFWTPSVIPMGAEYSIVLFRDLSARNCLLGGEDCLTVKISDFGMSREGSSYEVGGPRQLPVKWTAPEAINRGVYTTKSDVWSYGVLMWEIFSHGMMPYGSMSNTEVVEQLRMGNRLFATSGTPDDIANLMQDCWKEYPEERPTFTEIKHKINQPV